MVNVLLVEDDDLDVINVERNFKKKKLNACLTVARNGQEALNIIQDASSDFFSDIILLDINMPKMNGVDLLKILRNDERFRKIKVFILSTSNEPKDKEQMETLGISGYITKPLDFSNYNNSKDNLNLLIDLINY